MQKRRGSQRQWQLQCPGAGEDSGGYGWERQPGRGEGRGGEREDDESVQVSLMSSETWEEMHLNATDGVLVQKSVKVLRNQEEMTRDMNLVLSVHSGRSV